MSWERRHSNKSNEKLSNDSNDKIRVICIQKLILILFHLKMKYTQLYVIQRRRRTQVLNLKKNFIKGAQSSSNAFREINFGKNGSLTFYVDLDAPDASLIDQIQSGEVGHTWIALEWFVKKCWIIFEPHKRYLEGGKTADQWVFENMERCN